MASEVEEYKKMTGKDFYSDKDLIDPKTNKRYDWDSSSPWDIDDDDLAQLRKVNRELRRKEQERVKVELQRPLNEVRAKAMGMNTKSPALEMLKPNSVENTPVMMQGPNAKKQASMDDVVAAITGLQISIDRNSDVTQDNSEKTRKNTDATKDQTESQH